MTERCDRPWSTIEDRGLRDAVAYTFWEERQVAVWLARDCYKGRGYIIDAGAFFGGSALSLALGLRDNASVPESDKNSRIHVFDVFTWARWIKPTLIPPGTEMGTSFLSRFHDTVMQYSDYLVIHPGDISQKPWRFGPIETLLIDCAKSFSANASIVEKFFPSLIPGAIVNQQDYAIASRLVWVHATMEYFWKKFVPIGVTTVGGTTLFRLVETISHSEAAACVNEMRTGLLDMARAAADRYDASDRRRLAVTSSLASFSTNPLPI